MYASEYLYDPATLGLQSRRTLADERDSLLEITPANLVETVLYDYAISTARGQLQDLRNALRIRDLERMLAGDLQS